ncbi:MAG: sugar phosphate isomerase/epimerase [Fibrobacterales bacterium]
MSLVRNPMFLVPFRRNQAKTTLPFIKKHGLGIEVHDFRESEVVNNESTYQQVLKEVATILSDVSCLKTLHAPFRELSVFSDDTDIAAVSQKRIIDSLLTAQTLGCNKVVVHTGFNPLIADAQRECSVADKILAFYTTIADRFSDITICLENSFETSFLLFERIFSQETPPNLKMCLDTGHSHLFGQKSTAEIITQFNEHISHVHLHDNHRDRDAHLIPGQGTIDWASTAKALNTLHDPTLLIEVFDPKKIEYYLNDIELLLSIKQP